jgi:hypothetical protein
MTDEKSTIEASYDPIDVGFDLRVQKMSIDLPGGPFDTYRLTYTTSSGIMGERRTVVGTRRAVIARLEAAGYEVARPKRSDP